MKRSLVIAAGFVLGLAVGLALWASTATTPSANAAPAAAKAGILLAAGIYCKPAGGGVVCVVLNNPMGHLGVGITKKLTMVMDLRTGKIVYSHAQPGYGG